MEKNKLFSTEIHSLIIHLEVSAEGMFAKY